MQFSNVKVEQIDSINGVVIDYGEILSGSEILNIAREVFPETELKDGCLYGRYNKTDFCLYFKNVSYLGNPHPIYKKRIQIPDTFKDLFDNNANKNIKTLLLGVYKYKDVILFCDFDSLFSSSSSSFDSDLLFIFLFLLFIEMTSTPSSISLILL